MSTFKLWLPFIFANSSPISSLALFRKKDELQSVLTLNVLLIDVLRPSCRPSGLPLTS
jgi:hypothetical protein